MNSIYNTLNKSNSTTLASQLKTIFKEKIDNGEWSAGTMIPSENKLSEIYGVSRMTVRAVLTEFVSQGYLSRYPGKGTFVTDTKIELSSLRYGGIRGQLEEKGHSVSTRLISCELISAENYEASKLEVPVGTPLYKIKRVRFIGEEPVSFHESYVPATICPGLNTKPLETEQLCSILNTDYNLQKARTVETLETFSADNSRARYLGVRSGFTLLLLENKLYAADGRMYEFSNVYFRGDKIKVRIEYID